MAGLLQISNEALLSGSNACRIQVLRMFHASAMVEDRRRKKQGHGRRGGGKPTLMSLEKVKSSFQRDELPHSEIDLEKQEDKAGGTVSFRRHDSSQDLRKRKGRWHGLPGYRDERGNMYNALGRKAYNSPSPYLANMGGRNREDSPSAPTIIPPSLMKHEDRRRTPNRASSSREHWNDPSSSSTNRNFREPASSFDSHKSGDGRSVSYTRNSGTRQSAPSFSQKSTWAPPARSSDSRQFRPYEAKSSHIPGSRTETSDEISPPSNDSSAPRGNAYNSPSPYLKRLAKAVEIRKAPSAESSASFSSSSSSPSSFASFPLMPGLLSCLTEVVGTGSQPTPIQALSLQHLLETEYDPNKKWKEYLLASETGSGKSIAYFLPLLQSLKVSELSGNVHRKNTHPLNPRALILAPTHELARQLSGFAKDLIHEIKLRILCASQANVDNKMSLGGGSAAQMKGKLDAALFSNHSQDLQVRPGGRFPVDVVVGTPMKLLELIKGRGWERRIGNETPKAQEESTEEGEEKEDEEFQRKPRRGRDLGVVPTGTLGAAPEMGLANVEWVIVDEADVLFDPDFQETTRLLLSEVSAARGSPVPYYPDDFNFKTESVEPKPISYPYNLILCSATIPSALGNYLETHHPSHTRLASPTVHHLPKKLQTEYVGWTGTNKNADIEKRIRKVWAEDSITRSGKLSKILVFCNKNIKVQLLSQHLEGKGIKTVAIDGTAETRRRGSNHHLDGFLKDKSEEKVATKEEGAGDPSETPHVMITTSLLSRGLDFSPQIKHVFIVDEPRNMIDFIHRAGRSGRAGEKGKVVVFGKLEGRGSSRAVDLRKRVGALTA
ncbi:uncharacterized protein ARMOST_12825 [Armillaria ostoyae]|uniref:RNA helicase n=1 Tax=Armillaria ostoyae TaxID=47428 RepID=A0A284RL12_ARMOS|nr:uncharacterized protein ARMOST_12825 [Armillaria ostoyae]